MTRLFVFDTTHHALHAEQVGLARGLGIQVVPAPADAHAKCDLALECLAEDADALETAMREAEVPYRLHVTSRRPD